MYGLYRAWFGGTAAGGGYPCLQDTFSPPDTVVRVGNEGEHQFVAHKGVLAAHSGYLKALLASAAPVTATTPAATTTTTTTMMNPSSSSSGDSSSAGRLPLDPACATVAAVAIGQSQRSQPVTSVSVSSVGGEAFAPLLNYMYTGRLEVTLDNVYSVLLATHLLHMPGALEQCRAALLRLRAPPPPPPLPVPVPTSAPSTATSPPRTGSILRPIPSRLLVGPPLCWPPTTPLYPTTAPASTVTHLPHMPSVMMQSAVHPPGINVVAPSVREKQEQCARYSASEVSRSPQSSPTHARHKRPRLSSRSRTPEIVSTVALPFVAAAAAAFTAFAVTSGATSSTTRGSSKSRSVSPAPSSVSRTHSPPALLLRATGRKLTTTTTIAERQVEARDDQRRNLCLDGSADDASRQDRGNNATGGGDASSEHDRARSSRRRARSAASGKETTASSTVYSVIYDVACCDGPVRFHRVLNESYSSTASSAYSGSGAARGISHQRTYQPNGEDPTPNENDENGGPTARSGITRSPSMDSSNDAGNDDGNNGNCYTCGYCKHTFKSQYCYRKHAKRHLLPTQANETSSLATNVGASDTRQQEVARGSRREVRLLDLNVQYYPCKICGCKFPSYYFVHKHRKLCHAADEERQTATADTSVPSHDAEASPPVRNTP